MPSFVSASPSGSRLSGANGWPDRVAQRRDGQDLDGRGAAGDADPERVEARRSTWSSERRRRRRGARRRRCPRDRRTCVPWNCVAVGKICWPRNSSSVDGAACAGAEPPRARSRAAGRVSSRRPSSRGNRTTRAGRPRRRSRARRRRAQRRRCWTPPSASQGVRSLWPRSASAASSSVFSIGSAMLGWHTPAAVGSNRAGGAALHRERRGRPR